MNYLAEAKKNKYLILLFILSTSFFIWQHSVNLSWDFSTYAENARYWRGGSYYEVGRSPLVPFMLFILGVFGFLGEYIFIVLVSLLFFYSTIRFADKLKISSELFYLFSLSPIVLFYGMINGTELLSLALLELFFIYLIDKKPKQNDAKASAIGGIFLGLALLARYSFLIFLPLVFSNRYPRKILATLALFALMITPWLLFNFLTTGNMLTSLADSYALNFKYRYYFTQPASIVHILAALSFFLPLFIAGVYKVIREWDLNTSAVKFLCKEKTNILLIIIFALTLYQYASTPSKELRYLFPIALPVAYFSAVGAGEIKKKSGQLLAVVGIVVILNLAYFATMNVNAYEPKEKYQQAIEVMDSLNISNCQTLSNAWPLLNYIGKAAEPFPRKEALGKSIDEGNFIVFFYSIQEPDWANSSFLHGYPVVHENKDFIILGSWCNAPRRYEHYYTMLLHEKILDIHNISINTNPCFVMFESSVMEKTCNFINLHGFRSDENRESGLYLIRD